MYVWGRRSWEKKEKWKWKEKRKSNENEKKKERVMKMKRKERIKKQERRENYKLIHTDKQTDGQIDTNHSLIWDTILNNIVNRTQ